MPKRLNIKGKFKLIRWFKRETSDVQVCKKITTFCKSFFFLKKFLSQQEIGFVKFFSKKQKHNIFLKFLKGKREIIFKNFTNNKIFSVCQKYLSLKILKNYQNIYKPIKNYQDIYKWFKNYQGANNKPFLKNHHHVLSIKKLIFKEIIKNLKKSFNTNHNFNKFINHHDYQKSSIVVEEGKYIFNYKNITNKQNGLKIKEILLMNNYLQQTS